MHAVARGAAYYGLARQGKGVRVRGGVPRSYYIGIETAMPAVPGLRAPLKALTVVPFGMEEGTGHQIRGPRVRAERRRAGAIPLLSSRPTRKDDPPGSLIEEIGDRYGGARAGGGIASRRRRRSRSPVTLEALVTETGVLELWFVARDGRRWKLEFNVRAR